MQPTIRVAYVEASIGQRWNLAEFGRRVGDERYVVRFVGEYAFDKTARVTELLADSTGRPHVLVLQECSVYFPGPLSEYQRLYRGWIEQIRAAGVTPVVATSIPPARRRALVEGVKEFVKVRLLGRPAAYEQIVAFNRWLRELARDEGFARLDLEAALGTGPDDAHMAPRYDAGDGIHVNRAAYDVMDRALLSVLREITSRLPAAPSPH